MLSEMGGDGFARDQVADTLPADALAPEVAADAAPDAAPDLPPLVVDGALASF